MPFLSLLLVCFFFVTSNLILNVNYVLLVESNSDDGWGHKGAMLPM